MSKGADMRGVEVIPGSIVIAIHGDYKTLEYAQVIKITPKGFARVKYRCSGIRGRLTTKLCSPDQFIALDEEEINKARLEGKLDHLFHWDVI